MGIFKAPKAGSQSNELIVGRLTGVMDLKIFYKGKNRGEESRVRPESWKLSRNINLNFIVIAVIGSISDFSFSQVKNNNSNNIHYMLKLLPKQCCLLSPRSQCLCRPALQPAVSASAWPPTHLCLPGWRSHCNHAQRWGAVPVSHWIPAPKQHLHQDW